MDENLIIGYLQHTLNDEETRRFNLWLNESSENRKLFKEFKKVWSVSQESVPLSDSELENEFEKFKYRFFHSEDHKQSLFSRWYIVSLKYAAVFVFAFLSANYFTRKDHKEQAVLQANFNEIRTKPGESSLITLADGSKIWVNACTSLKYPVNLLSEHIDIYLDGEAYFDLKKLPKRNITVHTSRLNINVIGTAFNLKSYADDDIIETTLVRGKISITNPDKKDNREQPVFLSPNQTAVYFKKKNSLEVPALARQTVHSSETQEGLEQLASKSQTNLIVVESIDPSQTSWIDGKFIFRKETFEKLTKRLERKYNVKIAIKDERLKKTRFSGTFDKESIEQALKALSYPVPFNYRIIKDSVIIQQK